jgi:hypothetical protein
LRHILSRGSTGSGSHPVGTPRKRRGDSLSLDFYSLLFLIYLIYSVLSIYAQTKDYFNNYLDPDKGRKKSTFLEIKKCATGKEGNGGERPGGSDQRYT